MPDLQPIVPTTTVCKVCGSGAALYGVVDFNKNCEANRNRFPLAMAGIPIYYHRCDVCRLIFTIAFDEFTADDFLRMIYNDGYILVDPDYPTVRPESNARTVLQLFGRTPGISILDYGGGNGRSAELMRKAGFTDVTTYDPFVPGSATLPTRTFDLIICFEVVEHTHTPLKTFDQMASLVAPTGMILFSTNTQPAEIDRLKLDWWYAGPRNGHVTLYSIDALHRIAERLRCNCRSSNGMTHAMFRTVPEFARHIFPT